MAEMMSGDYDAVDIAAELKLSKTSGKESKNRT